MFTDEVAREITTVAQEFGIEPAALFAIAELESGGRTFATVGGRREPMIRFEGHYFDRFLSGAARELARGRNLSSPKAGAVANPASQAARWRLVERGCEIDREAALASVSWGLGQVMGSHWAWLGFAGIDEFVDQARSGAAGQARLMARYLEKSGLLEALATRNWEVVARGYNGPGYAKSSYHLKLAAAYRRHAQPGAAARSGPVRGLLRRGSAGKPVRDLQKTLSALGYPVRVDGTFGSATEKAVRAFQAWRGLAADGIVGPRTLAAIKNATTARAPWEDLWATILAWLKKLSR